MGARTNRKPIRRHRDAITGRMTTAAQAAANPATTVAETDRGKLAAARAENRRLRADMRIAIRLVRQVEHGTCGLDTVVSRLSDSLRCPTKRPRYMKGARRR